MLYSKYFSFSSPQNALISCKMCMLFLQITQMKVKGYYFTIIQAGTESIVGGFAEPTAGVMNAQKTFTPNTEAIKHV